MTIDHHGLSRRRVLRLGAGGAMAAFLAACAAGGNGPSGTSSGNLEYWSGFASKDAENWFRANIVDAFNATRPKAPVTLSVKQFDTMDRLVQTALAAGAGPDIVLASGPAQVRAYADAGYLAPLDDFAAKLGWNDRVLPWALKTGVISGKLYALPSNYESLLCFYNPATLAQHGWTYPKTRAEFEALCAEAAGKSILPVAAGNADYQGANEWHVSIILNHAAGPEAMRQALTGKAKFTDAVFVDAVTQLKGYFTKGWYGGGVDRYFTNTFSSQYQQLAAGKALFNFTGTWGLGEITPFFGKEAGNSSEWAWGAIPSLRDGVPQEIWELSLGGTFSVNARSKHLDEAAALVDFLLSDPKRQAAGLSAAGLGLAPIKISQADFPADMDKRTSTLFAAIAAATDVGYTTWTFFPPKTDTYIIQSWEKVITGALSPQDYCKEIDSLFTSELTAGAVPPLPQ
ncbi:extracellular solute-binding protein [Dactylosporangium sp. NPDC005572]|uniref:ABC transporter substrate-binding protein n=1 Tax=Dactylosporangium sp. NPDC005572 TaxID=3156889 RepID=UPI0033B49281